MNEQKYEQVREDSVWKSSIKMMYQRGDLEGLIDLREGPKCLSEDVIALLDERIKKLKEQQKERSQED